MWRAVNAQLNRTIKMLTNNEIQIKRRQPKSYNKITKQITGIKLKRNNIYIYKVSKVGDHSRGWPEGPLFDSLLHQGVGEGATPFPGLLHFTLDPYLIMLSAKQGGIKYHFLSLWYDSTWDWTQVSRAIGEHSNRWANVRYNIYIYIYIYILAVPGVAVAQFV